MLCCLGNIIIRIPGIAFYKYGFLYLIAFCTRYSSVNTNFQGAYPDTLFYLAGQTTSIQSSKTLTYTIIPVQSKHQPRLSRHFVSSYFNSCFCANCSRDHKVFIMVPKSCAHPCLCVVASVNLSAWNFSSLPFCTGQTRYPSPFEMPIPSGELFFFLIFFLYFMHTYVLIIIIICLYFCLFPGP